MCHLPNYLYQPPYGVATLAPEALDLLERLYRHDADTLAHSWRVAGLSVSLYARLLDPQARSLSLQALHHAALLHDIGKLSIPRELLQAPRALIPEERCLMQCHASEGGLLLDTLGEPLRTLSIEIAVGHHECWDGSGYPGQIMTKALPLHCRVVGLMDVFDALASPRAYKAGWPLDRLIALFVAQAGRQFDPQLIGRLSPLWKELLAVHHQLLDQTRSD